MQLFTKVGDFTQVYCRFLSIITPFFRFLFDNIQPPTSNDIYMCICIFVFIYIYVFIFIYLLTMRHSKPK